MITACCCGLTLEFTGLRMAKTSATAAEKRRMAQVAALGCLICKRPAQVHHCFTHMGGGRDHKKVIPLCVDHHTGGGHGVAIHAGKTVWETIYGTEQELLDNSLRRQPRAFPVF